MTKTNSKQFQEQLSTPGSRSDAIRNLHYMMDEDSLRDELQALDEDEAADGVEASFSSGTFYTVFAIYLVYFTLLGPLICVAVLIKPKLRSLFAHLQLLCFSLRCASHLMVWVLFQASLTVFLRQTCCTIDRDTLMEMTILKTAMTGVVLLSALNSAKVATRPKRISRQPQLHFLDTRQRTNEAMLGRWRRQERATVEREICCSIERRDLDFSTLKVSFMSDVNQKVIRSIESLASQRTNRATSYWLQHYSMNQKELSYFRSDYLIEYLVTEFNRSRSLKAETAAAILLCFLWSVESGVLRYFFGQGWHAIGLEGFGPFYSQVLVCGSIFTLHFLVYRQAVADLNRKHFLMSQLSYMMSPKYLKKYSAPKLLPTLNILDSISIRSWQDMHSLVFEYGRTFFLRQQAFLLVNLFLLVANIILFFGTLYFLRAGIIKTTLTQNWRFLYSAVIDSVVFMWICSHYIYSAGKLNDEIEQQARLASQNKGLVDGLLEFKNYYFGDIIGTKGKFGRDLSHILPDPSASLLHQLMQKEVVKYTGLNALQPDDADRELTLFLKELAAQYDQLSSDIQREREFNLVKIMGVGVTRFSVINFGFAVASGIFAVYQLLLQG